MLLVTLIYATLYIFIVNMRLPLPPLRYLRCRFFAVADYARAQRYAAAAIFYAIILLMSRLRLLFFFHAATAAA